MDKLLEKLVDRLASDWKAAKPNENPAAPRIPLDDLGRRLEKSKDDSRYLEWLQFLVKDHLDYWLKDCKGEGANAEAYLSAYPELREDKEFALELMRWEFLFRANNDAAFQPDIWAADREEFTRALTPLVRKHLQNNPPKQLLKGLVVKKRLGFGSQGTVYLAEEIAENGKIVGEFAVKVIALPTGEEKKRALNEARAHKKLDHPNIVRILDYTESPLRIIIQMQFFADGSLADLLESGPLKCRKAANLIYKMALAVQYAHDQGCLHRDVKPDNILLAGNKPFLSDFGLVKTPWQEKQTKTGAVIGTKCYISPEQACGDKNIDERTDVYSLGATLYHCLTGAPPPEFDATSAGPNAIPQRSMAQSPDWENPLVDKKLSAICMKSLHPDRDQRYQTAKELADDLRACLAREQISANPRSVFDEVIVWGGKNLIRVLKVASIAVLALFAVAVLSVGTAYFFRAKSEVLTKNVEDLEEKGQKREIDLAETQAEINKINGEALLGQYVAAHSRFRELSKLPEPSVAYDIEKAIAELKKKILHYETLAPAAQEKLQTQIAIARKKLDLIERDFSKPGNAPAFPALEPVAESFIVRADALGCGGPANELAGDTLLRIGAFQNPNLLGKAAKYYEQAIPIEPHGMQAYLKQAICRFYLGDAAKAAELYDAFLRKTEGTPDMLTQRLRVMAFYCRGVVNQFGLRDHDKAFADYSKVIDALNRKQEADAGLRNALYGTVHLVRAGLIGEGRGTQEMLVQDILNGFSLLGEKEKKGDITTSEAEVLVEVLCIIGAEKGPAERPAWFKKAETLIERVHLPNDSLSRAYWHTTIGNSLVREGGGTKRQEGIAHLRDGFKILESREKKGDSPWIDEIRFNLAVVRNLLASLANDDGKYREALRLTTENLVMLDPVASKLSMKGQVARFSSYSTRGFAEAQIADGMIETKRNREEAERHLELALKDVNTVIRALQNKVDRPEWQQFMAHALSVRVMVFSRRYQWVEALQDEGKIERLCSAYTAKFPDKDEIWGYRKATCWTLVNNLRREGIRKNAKTIWV